MIGGKATLLVVNIHDPRQVQACATVVANKVGHVPEGTKSWIDGGSSQT